MTLHRTSATNSTGEAVDPHPSPMPAALAEVLDVLRARFLLRLLRRLEELRENLARGCDDAETRDAVRRVGHQIRGTAGSVGLHEIGAHGLALEQMGALARWTPEDVVKVREAIALAEQAATEARLGASSTLQRSG